MGLLVNSIIEQSVGARLALDTVSAIQYWKVIGTIVQQEVTERLFEVNQPNISLSVRVNGSIPLHYLRRHTRKSDGRIVQLCVGAGASDGLRGVPRRLF